MLIEIKNRGTQDVCIVVCDGLTGLPEAITTVWGRAIVQTYVNVACGVTGCRPSGVADRVARFE